MRVLGCATVPTEANEANVRRMPPFVGKNTRARDSSALLRAHTWHDGSSALELDLGSCMSDQVAFDVSVGLRGASVAVGSAQ